MKYLFFLITIFFLPLSGIAQLPTCNGASASLIYFDAGINGQYIYTFDPLQTISTSNPSLNSISGPSPFSSGGLTVCENINTIGPSPTFYTASQGYYYYYNGVTWVNTGHTDGGGGGGNLGGGGGFIYNLAGLHIYKYDGTSNASQILLLPSSIHPVGDIASDCEGNFYLLDINDSIQWLRKYSSNGSLLLSWTISGIAPSNYTSGSLAMIGSKVYFDTTSTSLNQGFFVGTISGTNVSVASISGSITNGYYSGDFATCPLSINLNVAAITDTVIYCPGGLADTIYSSGTGSLTWSVLSGPATISGSGDTVTVTATANARIIVSDGYTYCADYSDTVNIIVPPSVSPTSNGPVCSGDSLKLLVNNWQVGASYNWSGPSFSDTGHLVIRTNMPLADSGYYSVTETLQGCTSSDSVFVSVKQSPAIPIAASNSPVCVGDTIKLTITNPQAGVGYYWSGPVGFSVNAQNPTRPNAQSSYAGLYSAIASLNGCTTFATTTVTVNPILGPPTLSISASPDTICAGGTVTLSAVAGNAGSSPAYLWRRNGTIIPGANSPVFTTSNIANGDHIVCKVTSNAPCQHTDTALSNSLTMNVILIPPPTVTVTSYPASYISGDTVTFTGHLPSNTNGYTYQWRKNGMDIPGATFSIYTTSNVHIGDTICLVVHSSIPCTIPDTAIACVGLTEGVNSLQSAIGSWQVYPNPFSESLTLWQAQYSNGEGIMRIKIYDIVGRQVYSGTINTSSPLERPGEATINTHNFSKGTYILELSASDGSRDIRNIVKE